MEQELADFNEMPRECRELSPVSDENSRHVYSKDFLLSVANLEYCQKVPPGIDPVVLRDAPSDLVDGGVTIQALSSKGLIRRDRESDGPPDSLLDVPEWRRPSNVSGSSLLQQGPRRSELPGNPRPTWGDNAPTRNNVERFGAPASAGHGRWEYRSGPGDREKDRNRPRRESDLAESGRSGWVAQEHDGLLGSGGAICQGGLMPRQLDRHHGSGRIGRTGEMYHPTRAGKILSASSREDNDSINDETFGPEDKSNEERSEKERQRRESFEQMRKEQQRYHKESLKSQYQNAGETPQSDRKHGDSSLWDAVQNNEALPSSSPGTPQSSSSKEDISKMYNKVIPATTSIPHTPRLLIPPGFSKTALQKSSSIKENGAESKVSLLNVEDENSQIAKHMEQNGEMGSDLTGHSNNSVAGMDRLADSEEDNWCHSQPKTSKFTGFFSAGEGISQQRAPSTRESLGTVPLLFKSESMSPSSTTLNNHFDPGTTSKKLVLNESNAVTSLFPVNGQAYVPSMPIGPSLEDVERLMTASGSNSVSSSSIKDLWTTDFKSSSLEDMPFHSDSAALSDKSFFSEVLGVDEPSSKHLSQSKRSPVFLKCEDIEQSIIAESVQFSGNEMFVADMVELPKDIPQSTSTFSQSLQSCSEKNRTESTGYQGLVGSNSQIDTDINASRHLMSLLQKGNKVANQTSSLEQSVTSTPDDSAVYPAVLSQVTKGTEEGDTDSSAADIQTLEMLFGKAIVNELKSVAQPVSEKSLQDDAVNGDKEDDFQSFLHAVASNRQPNKCMPVSSSDGKHVRGVQAGRNSFSIDSDFGMEFSKEGEALNLQRQGALMGKRNKLSSFDTDRLDELWPNISSHVLPQMARGGQNYDNAFFSGGRPVGKLFSSDTRHSQLPAHLAHRGHLLHPSGGESPYRFSAPRPSHGLSFESMHGLQNFHDNAPNVGRLNEHVGAMSILPPDGAFNPFHAELFHQPGQHVQGRFGQHSGGQSPIARAPYRMPSPYPSEFAESPQQGFDLHDRVVAPHGSAIGINPPVAEKFTGDSIRISQGVPGFSSFQPHAPGTKLERKVAYGNSDMGIASGGPAGMGVPWHDCFNSEMKWSAQNVPRFNPQARPPSVTPDRKLAFG